MIKDILLVFIGGVFSAFGFLAQRMLSKASTLEDLDIQLKLLEIKKQQKEQNVSDEELEKMRARLPKRVSGPGHIIEFAQGPPEFKTQAQMLEYADSEYRILESDLRDTLTLLNRQRDDTWRKQLEQSQLAWLEYRNKQAKLASEQYKGGSIAPFIYVTEINDITKQRIAELRLMLLP
jgi:uncharacterized protein YecT (DUF1311 family)